ncbi:MAG TPA: hypothetical protein DEA22_13150 [Blastocatellia bacterium]|nr:hypothetical protein [Blastocatellia bacterium]
MGLTLVILGVAVAAFSGALGSRDRESSKTDAITSAQAALNIMTREIGNAGFGLKDQNGLVYTDCTDKRLRFRANTVNSNGLTNSAGEDVSFYYDTPSQSVVRHDTNANVTSGIINRVSDVDFIYYNFQPDGSSAPGAAGLNTGRVNITLRVMLADVRGQPTGQTVTVTSDITLRNSPYMLGQY